MNDTYREEMMFDRQFLQSRLGKAAMLSVAMMATFVALSSQMYATPAFAATTYGMVELA